MAFNGWLIAVHFLFFLSLLLLLITFIWFYRLCCSFTFSRSTKHRVSFYILSDVLISFSTCLGICLRVSFVLSSFFFSLVCWRACFVPLRPCVHWRFCLCASENVVSPHSCVLDTADNQWLFVCVSVCGLIGSLSDVWCMLMFSFFFLQPTHLLLWKVCTISALSSD